MKVKRVVLASARAGKDLGFRTMYAIAFDLNQNTAPVGDAYQAIREYLEQRGFSWRQRSLYYGNESMTRERTNEIVCEMATEYPWFEECVSDIRVLKRIPDDDLMAAVKKGHALVPKPRLVHTVKAG